MTSVRLIAVIALLWSSSAVAQSQPVLLFSDLTWGPKTGWEGSSSKGAAVTIWGTNLGMSGSVNACGQTLSSSDATSIAEWGATTNPQVPRGLSRITFWLNSAMSATCAEGLAVSVGGQSSNVLPFTIAAANIYFVSASDGSDSYNGLYSTRTGHSGSDGPFAHAYKFNPANGLGDNQYIMYIRQGTYTTLDPFDSSASALIELYGALGSSTKQKALVAYPTELATLDPKSCVNGAVYPNTSSGAPGNAGQINYITWSKLNFNGVNTKTPEDALDFFGQYNRFIGNNVVNFRPSSQLQSGFIFVGASQYGDLYGNYFYNNGYDSYAHNIYIKSQTGYAVGATLETTHDIDVGWNEISTPFSNDAHGGSIFLSRESAMPSGANTNHIYVHDNYFHDGTQGDFIYIGDGSPVDYVYIYNNLFTGGSSTAGTTGSVFFQTGAQHMFVYNNTFYQVASPASSNSCMYASSPNSSTQIQTTNNICYGLANQIMYTMESGGGSWTSTNDLFYNPSGSATWSGSITRNNPITNQDPQFVVNGSNFSLQSSSPARNAGVNLSGTMGGNPAGTIDYMGLSYPSSGGWDIGAITSTGGGTSSPPSPPSGLTATVQ